MKKRVYIQIDLNILIRYTRCIAKILGSLNFLSEDKQTQLCVLPYTQEYAYRNRTTIQVTISGKRIEGFIKRML